MISPRHHITRDICDITSDGDITLPIPTYFGTDVLGTTLASYLRKYCTEAARGQFFYNLNSEVKPLEYPHFSRSLLQVIQLAIQ